MVTVKVAAEITGLTIKGIRYYEKIGLVKPPSRSGNGYRFYSEEDIFRLQQIRFYREQEFSLEEIAEILAAPDDQMRSMLSQQLGKIESRIVELERVRLTLNNALNAANCALVLNRAEEAQHQLERRRTAIVAIDLQNDMTDGGTLTCKRMYNLYAPLKQFFTEARGEGIPIIYVCDSHHKGDPELELWPDHCIAGTWGAQIVDELKPEPRDYIVKKGYFNAFFKTQLQRTLKKLMVDTIIFTGWRTHVCVAQSAIEAYHLGYRVFVAEDGVDSTTQGEHEFGLNLLRVNYEIPVLPYEVILSGLIDSQTEGGT